MDIGAIGLDARALLFQVINFALLLLILRWVTYRPLLRILESRRQTIEESLRTAQLIAERKNLLVAQEKRILDDAEHKATAILQQTAAQAKTLMTQAEEQAAHKTQRLLEQARTAIDGEIMAARQQVKRELAQLVVLATEKILQEKLDPKRDHALITQSLKV